VGELAPLVHEAGNEARDALVETRRTMLGLLGSALDGRSLDEALGDEVEWARRTGQLDIRLVTAGDPAPLDPTLAHEIVRIAQEALTNIVQHADAHAVRLGVAYESLGVALLVQDDGIGFDPHTLPDDAGSGLRRMADRAHSVNGRVELDSMPGWGTSLRVRFPYAGPPPAADPRSLRVLVIDPQPLVRAGVTRLLAEASLRIEVVGEAATAAQALTLQGAVDADVIVTGLRLDDMAGGVDLTRSMVEAGRAAIVCLSEPGDDELVVAALRAGAHGCLDRGVDGASLAQAVVAAGRGQAVLSGTALQRLHRGLRDDHAAPLTSREREVRALLETGLPDKLIAAQLMISVKTVEKHVSSLLRKGGVRNRTELVALARRR
jgi:DNA-binding NarL/FixJ family response regulator